jgi:hypothetical protein
VLERLDGAEILDDSRKQLVTPSLLKIQKNHTFSTSHKQSDREFLSALVHSSLKGHARVERPRKAAHCVRQLSLFPAEKEDRDSVHAARVE